MKSSNTQMHLLASLPHYHCLSLSTLGGLPILSNTGTSLGQGTIPMSCSAICHRNNNVTSNAGHSSLKDEGCHAGSQRRHTRGSLCFGAEFSSPRPLQFWEGSNSRWGKKKSFCLPRKKRRETGPPTTAYRNSERPLRRAILKGSPPRFQREPQPARSIFVSLAGGLRIRLRRHLKLFRGIYGQLRLTPIVLNHLLRSHARGHPVPPHGRFVQLQHHYRLLLLPLLLLLPPGFGPTRKSEAGCQASSTRWPEAVLIASLPSGSLLGYFAALPFPVWLFPPLTLSPLCCSLSISHRFTAKEKVKLTII